MVQIALLSCGYNLGGAHKVLLDQGFAEVVEAGLTHPQPSAPALPVPVPLPIPQPRRAPGVGRRSPSGSPLKGGLSLSEETHQRNQGIYTVSCGGEANRT